MLALANRAVRYSRIYNLPPVFGIIPAAVPVGIPTFDDSQAITYRITFCPINISLFAFYLFLTVFLTVQNDGHMIRTFADPVSSSLGSRTKPFQLTSAINKNFLYEKVGFFNTHLLIFLLPVGIWLTTKVSPLSSKALLYCNGKYQVPC